MSYWAVAGVVGALKRLRVWNSTYVFVTSDHGYNMGQHNLPSCKLGVYDNTIIVFNGDHGVRHSPTPACTPPPALLIHVPFRL